MVGTKGGSDYGGDREGTGGGPGGPAGTGRNSGTNSGGKSGGSRGGGGGTGGGSHDAPGGYGSPGGVSSGGGRSGGTGGGSGSGSRGGGGGTGGGSYNAPGGYGSPGGVSSGTGGGSRNDTSTSTYGMTSRGTGGGANNVPGGYGSVGSARGTTSVTGLGAGRPGVVGTNAGSTPAGYTVDMDTRTRMNSVSRAADLANNDRRGTGGGANNVPGGYGPVGGTPATGFTPDVGGRTPPGGVPTATSLTPTPTPGGRVTATPAATATGFMPNFVRPEHIAPNTPSTATVASALTLSAYNARRAGLGAAMRAAEDQSSLDMTALGEAYRTAVKGRESANQPNPYGTIGQNVKRGSGFVDNALGAYGVMRSNLSQWTKEVFGRPVDESTFLQSPAVQDRLFDAKFSRMVAENKGDLNAAMREWYGGKGAVSNPNASPQKGVAGPSANVYAADAVDRVNKAYDSLKAANRAGQPPAPTAATSPSGVPDAAPATAAAPGPTAGTGGGANNVPGGYGPVGGTVGLGTAANFQPDIGARTAINTADVTAQQTVPNLNEAPKAKVTMGQGVVAPTSDVVDRIAAAVAAGAGPGYSITLNSGLRSWGGHGRHPAGKAGDFSIQDPTGRTLDYNNPADRAIMDRVAISAARNYGVQGFGAGPNYMSGTAMHFDTTAAADLNSNQDQEWKAFNRPEMKNTLADARTAYAARPEYQPTGPAVASPVTPTNPPATVATGGATTAPAPPTTSGTTTAPDIYGNTPKKGTGEFPRWEPLTATEEILSPVVKTGLALGGGLPGAAINLLDLGVEFVTGRGLIDRGLSYLDDGTGKSTYDPYAYDPERIYTDPTTTPRQPPKPPKPPKTTTTVPPKPPSTVDTFVQTYLSPYPTPEEKWDWTSPNWLLR